MTILRADNNPDRAAREVQQLTFKASVFIISEDCLPEPVALLQKHKSSDNRRAFTTCTLVIGKLCLEPHCFTVNVSLSHLSSVSFSAAAANPYERKYLQKTLTEW